MEYPLSAAGLNPNLHNGDARFYVPVLMRRRKLALDEDLLSAGLNSPKLFREDCRLRLLLLEVGRPSVESRATELRLTLFWREAV